jgi:hypothetical protein
MPSKVGGDAGVCDARRGDARASVLVWAMLVCLCSVGRYSRGCGTLTVCYARLISVRVGSVCVLMGDCVGVGVGVGVDLWLYGKGSRGVRRCEVCP